MKRQQNKESFSFFTLREKRKNLPKIKKNSKYFLLNHTILIRLISGNLTNSKNVKKTLILLYLYIDYHAIASFAYLLIL